MVFKLRIYLGTPTTGDSEIQIVPKSRIWWINNGRRTNGSLAQVHRCATGTFRRLGPVYIFPQRRKSEWRTVSLRRTLWPVFGYQDRGVLWNYPATLNCMVGEIQCCGLQTSDGYLVRTYWQRIRSCLAYFRSLKDQSSPILPPLAPTTMLVHGGLFPSNLQPSNPILAVFVMAREKGDMLSRS